MKLLVRLVAFWALFSFLPIPSMAEAVVKMEYTLNISGQERKGVYTGNTANGFPDGFGIFEAQNSQGIKWHYVGEWEDGAMSGDGASYWETGQIQRGQYNHNSFVSGYVYSDQEYYSYMSQTSNDHGCRQVVYYRNDGSVIYNGCIGSLLNVPHIGTFYDKEGNVLDSGEYNLLSNWKSLYNTAEDFDAHAYNDKELRLVDEKVHNELSARKAESISEYATYEYKALARNPENYTGNKICVTGSIVQVSGNRQDGYYIRMTDGSNRSNIYFLFILPENVPSYNLLSGDDIEVLGVFAGDYTYQSITNVDITVPSIHVDSVELVTSE